MTEQNQAGHLTTVKDLLNRSHKMHTKSWSMKGVSVNADVGYLHLDTARPTAKELSSVDRST